MLLIKELMDYHQTKIFDENKRAYNGARNNCGFQNNLKFMNLRIAKTTERRNIINRNNSNRNCSYRMEDENNNNNRNRKRKNRKRKVIWFNPAFCKFSTINIGR